MVENKSNIKISNKDLIISTNLCLNAAFARCAELLEEGSKDPEIEAAAEVRWGIANSWPLTEIADKIYTPRILGIN